MTRRVEKGNFLSGSQLHLISADMLGDPAGLATHHIRLAQSVKHDVLP